MHQPVSNPRQLGGVSVHRPNRAALISIWENGILSHSGDRYSVHSVKRKPTSTLSTNDWALCCELESCISRYNRWFPVE